MLLCRWVAFGTVAQPLAPWPTPLPAMKLLHTENTQGQLAPRNKNIRQNQLLPSVTTHIYVIDKSLEGAAVNLTPYIISRLEATSKPASQPAHSSRAATFKIAATFILQLPSKLPTHSRSATTLTVQDASHCVKSNTYTQ